jgi:regulator of replication initiation timing
MTFLSVLNPFSDDGKQVPVTPIRQVAPVLAAPTAQVVNSPSKKYLDDLTESMQESALGGFDYLKYVAAMRKMQSVPDEGTRFRTAFIAAETLGVTKDKMVETARHYLDVLKGVYQNFQEMHQKGMAAKVGSKQTRLQEIDRGVSERGAQIKALMDENTKLQAEKLTLQTSIADASAELEYSKQNFEASYGSVVGEIEANIGKINQYV